jgi:hypothetical protein
MQKLPGRKGSAFDLPLFAEQALAKQADARVRHFSSLISSVSCSFIPNGKCGLRGRVPVSPEKNSRVISGAFALCSEL